MESKAFKESFNAMAKKNNFQYLYGGWFKESSECIIVLDLQKSNYGNYYELNIKVYIQGLFNSKYIKSKDLVKKDTGDVFTRQPFEYRELFNLDNQMNDAERIIELSLLFDKYITPFTDKFMTRQGIISMHANEGLFLLPAVKKELGIT